MTQIRASIIVPLAHQATANYIAQQILGYENAFNAKFASPEAPEVATHAVSDGNFEGEFLIALSVKRLLNPMLAATDGYVAPTDLAEFIDSVTVKLVKANEVLESLELIPWSPDAAI